MNFLKTWAHEIFIVLAALWASLGTVGQSGVVNWLTNFIYAHGWAPALVAAGSVVVARLRDAPGTTSFPKNAKLVIIALLLLFGAGTARAQSVPPAPNPFNDYTVAVNGGYSNVSNSPTNNGFTLNTELAISNSLAVRADAFILQNPNVTISLVGVQYSKPFSAIIKNPSSMVVKNLGFFLNLKVGDAYSTGTLVGESGITTQHKFAYGGGGGLEIALSPTVHFRPIDVTYVRSSMLMHGQALLGNHLSAAATLGLQF